MRGRLTIRSLLVNKYHMKDFGVYVWTSDRQMVCLPAWAYLFNKFWPYEQNVKILGYKKPSFALPKNFDFVSHTSWCSELPYHKLSLGFKGLAWIFRDSS